VRVSPFILIKSMAYDLCIILVQFRGHKGTQGDKWHVSPLSVLKSIGYERGTNGDILGGGEKTADGTQGTHTFRVCPVVPCPSRSVCLAL
jgi:hypothetical protein